MTTPAILILHMHSDGYKVAPLASDELANCVGKELRKEAREIVWNKCWIST
ncbi:hypothetical protein ACY1LM_01690 [Klebsiella pneumoniae]